MAIVPAEPIEAERLPEFAAALPGWLANGDYADTMQRLVEPIRDGVLDNFAKQASADGTPWPPRKRTKPKNPILILTSKLIQSAGSGPGHVERVGQQQIEYGNSLDQVRYARAHQEGNPGGNLPQREYMNIDDAHIDQAAELVADGLLTTLFG